MATHMDSRIPSPSESADLAARRRELLEQMLEEEGFAGDNSIPRRRSTGPAPLSYGQQRIWFLDRLSKGNSAYRVLGGVPLIGPLNVDALRQTIEMIVERHEALRTTFPANENGPMQVVRDSLPLDFQFLDVSGLPEAERSGAANRAVRHMAEQPFDLERGPVFRTLLTRVTPEGHLLAVVMHHIVSDGWSLQIFLRELGQIYGALAQGIRPELPPLRVQYADFSCWQREWLQGETMERQLAYWRRQLGGNLASLELPRDHARPQIQGFRGAAKTLTLSNALVERLNELSRNHRATLFMTMLAAFQVLMARLSGNEDVLVGTPVSGRNRLETEDLIGFFIQTIVIRGDLSGNPTFSQFLDQVRETSLGAQAHQDVPFEKLVEELHPQRDLSRTPIFQVFFNMVNIPPQEPVASAGLQMGKMAGNDEESKFDLTIYVVESGDKIIADFLYNPELFDAPRIEEMTRQYHRILQQICESPDKPVWSLSLVTDEARKLLPDTSLAISRAWHGAVHEKFSEQASRTPSRLAVADANERWTYEQLEQWSNRLAHHLRGAGIGAGDVVAIFVPRSATLIWAMLGVLKAGAAFLILDRAYPEAYLLECLRSAAPKAWIGTDEVAAPGGLADFAAELREDRRLQLPRLSSANSCKWLRNHPAAAPALRVEPDARAYVAFTSGSTGRPKGIEGTHRPISHFIDWHAETFRFSPSDRFSMLSGLSHDPLLRDIFTPLSVGASLHVPPQAEDRLGAWLRDEKITVMHCTPPLADLLAASERESSQPPIFSALRYAFFGGDSLMPRHVTFLRRVAPAVTCVNFYGATETPQAMAYSVVPLVDSGTEHLPIGSGIDGVQLLVLTRSRELAGIGELGEIYVRTPYLASGYLEQEASATRFVPDPFSSGADDRMFRTGDLGRYLPDGNVVCHGRGDDQVKVRGHRIELQHVQTVVAQHPGVSRCAVLASLDASGEKRLVAYYVRATSAGVDDRDLREFLRAKLPAHMVPSVIVAVGAIPLTPNGKIDRAALPVPEVQAAKSSYVGPRTEIERRLVKIWEQVLNVSSVGIHDNFFDLGGHSLLAVRLFSAVEKTFNRSLPVATIFQAPTIERFAGVLEQEGWLSAYSALVPIKPEGSAPPFFCVHSLGANLVSYGALAQRVGEDQPFYGLQPQGLDGTKPPHTRIEDMAAHYVEALRAVQRHGPYYLGGVCLGGVIAFEMAQQLLAAGENVGALLLMDSYCPGTPQHLPTRTLDYGVVEQLDWYLGDLMLLSAREKVKFVMTRMKNVMTRVGHGARSLAGRAVPSFAPTEAEVERVMAHVKSANSQAWQHYKPKRYPRKIVLFWCSEVPTRCYRDRRLAWSEVADGGLEVHAIPGNHMTMVEPPHVETMAQTLRDCLLAAQRESEISQDRAFPRFD